MSRELIVKPLGLVTRPNVYGQYPSGALSTATNCVMRAPGILESAPNTVLGTSYGASNNVVHQLLSLPSTVMLSWVNASGTWTIYGNSTASTYLPTSPVPTYSSTGRISPIVMRDRVIVNSDTRGQYVCDPLKQTPPAEFRPAGFGQGAFNAITSTTGGALVQFECVGYSVLYKRVFSDGYTLVSGPSPIYIYNYSGGAPINPQLQVWMSSRGLVPGDIVELYRTGIISKAPETADPGTTCFKIAAKTLTSSDIAGITLTLTDTSVHTPLGNTTGEAMYTNPGQEGLLNANRKPEVARCCASFKSFAFYGNILQRPQLKFKVPGGNGGTIYSGWDTVAFRTNGIGFRGFTGTVTSGSPTVTAISAANLVGVVPGQIIAGVTAPYFAGTETILSVGVSSITFSANATSSGVGVSLLVNDRIEINGAKLGWVGYGQGMVTIFQTAGILDVYTDLPVTAGAYSDGTQDQVTWLLEPSIIDSSTPLTVRATNGQNYSPQLPEISATVQTLPYQPLKNLLTWSKESQPEHVPVINQTFVGTGEIIALESTRDALWIFCTDGLFRLSGDGGQWRVDTMDTTLVLSSPRASCVLAETVYAYTNRGLVRITDAGVEPLSERIIGDLLPGAEYTETASILVERHETEDEIVIRVGTTQVYVYNTRENAFTSVAIADVTAMAYVRYPVSGNAALAFGRSPSGSTPRYELWNATASFLGPTLQFQPVFADDPFAAKRWIDATYIFSSNAAGNSNIVATWNGGNLPGTNPSIRGGSRYVNEARAQLGVPRFAATGNSLALGFILSSSSTANKLFGVSVRYKTIGEQNLKR